VSCLAASPWNAWLNHSVEYPDGVTYRRRIVDDTLDEFFPHLAAIALEGAKGVGKTETGKTRARTVVNLSLAEQRRVLAGNLAQVVALPPPVLIDEWQLVPDVWDYVRHAVDEDRTGGRFLLAGSAAVAPGLRLHSGAGRIVSLTMRPLTIAERGISQPTVSLKALLAGGRPDVFSRCEVGLDGYVDEILASGFPGIRDLPERVRRRQLASYIDRVVERELPDNGVEVRRPEALRRWLRAYGAATATDAKYSVILDAATGGQADKPTRSTTDAYREHLSRLFLLDPVPAWTPGFNFLKRLGRAPKHHLVDPALAAVLAGVGREGLMLGRGGRLAASAGTWLGALFESLAVQSVRVYAEAADATIGHLRLWDSTREVDLIVEGADRRVVACEVKLAATVTDHDVRHLNWLEAQLGDGLADKIALTTGAQAYRRPDGVAVVPLALLGP